MPSIISMFTPPLVASSAEEQCVVRSRTTTLYTVDSHGQISFSISESVSESDQLSNEDFSKLIGKLFRDDEDERMCIFVSCLSSRVNIPKHFGFVSSKLEWRCILWGQNCFTPKHLIEFFKQAGFHPSTWSFIKQAGMNVIILSEISSSPKHLTLFQSKLEWKSSSYTSIFTNFTSTSFQMTNNLH